MTDDVYAKPMVYEEDGKVVYRASSFGSCVGALVRARLGVTPSPPSDMMMERYQEGHDWERDVLVAGLGVDWMQVETRDHLALYGEVVDAGDAGLQVQTELAWGNKVIRCHPDAIAVHRGTLEKRVVEVKFLGEQMAQEMIHGLTNRYAWQSSIEMLSTGLPMLYVIGVKDVKGEGDAREVVGIRDVTVKEWDEPLHSLMDVKMRVAEVEGYVARGEIPKCPLPLDFPCDYWKEHDEKEQIAECDDQMLVHLVESYTRNASKLEAMGGEKEQIRKSIDARLGELGLEAARCAGWMMTLTKNRPGNVSWAKWAKEVKKRHPEVEDVLEDDFRGAEVLGGIKMEKEKGDA